jgi:hypothetical protein
MAAFTIQKQQQSEWCWSAVAVTLDKYFNPASTLTQCQLADEVVTNGAGQKACQNPAGSNKPAELKLAIQKVNRLRLSVPEPLSFDQLCQEIDAGRPVAVAIEWESGGGHAVIVTGYQVLPSGACLVHVEDPLNPSSTVDFDEFANRYYGDGVWTETELIQSW